MAAFIMIVILFVFVVWLLLRAHRPSLPLTIQVKGVSYANRGTGVERQEIIRRCHRGEEVHFVPEPDNPVDPNAVEIVLADGEQIGYVAADRAFEFKRELAAGQIRGGRIKSIFRFARDPFKRRGATVELETFREPEKRSGQSAAKHAGGQNQEKPSWRKRKRP